MRRNPWTALVVLALAQFMVVLDVTIVNVALPDIQGDLGFTAEGLQWVVGAYTLAFGGFLLLGGRAGDLVGRRRLFLAGLALFGVASLASGLAPSDEWLIGLRAAQGLGGALLSPAAFSILTVTFAHGRERNIAMGVWGGLAGLGGTLGTVIGGFLVDALSWRWIFLVNVPMVALLLAVVPLVITESRAPREEHARRTFDIAGAMTSTVGLLALMLAVIRAEPLGWGSTEVVGLLVAAAVLLGAFVLVERRSADPLVPMSLFRSRGLSTATAALALNGAAFLSMFFLTAIYLQQVRGMSALSTGVHLLPMGVAAIVSAVIAAQLVTRWGTRPVQLIGAALSVAGLLLLSRTTPTGSYATELLPGLVLFGVGIIATGTAAQVAAVADVSHHVAGAASGVVNAGFQVGGALGLAVISTLSTAQAESATRDGASLASALTDAYEYGLVGAALFSAVIVLVTFFSPAVHPTPEQVAEAGVAA